MDLLENHDFPGNVRELENIIERGVAINTGHSIEVAHLPENLRESVRACSGKKKGAFPPSKGRKKPISAGCSTRRAATRPLPRKCWGSDRVSLWRKLKSYELEIQ